MPLTGTRAIRNSEVRIEDLKERKDLLRVERRTRRYGCFVRCLTSCTHIARWRLQC